MTIMIINADIRYDARRETTLPFRVASDIVSGVIVYIIYAQVQAEEGLYNLQYRLSFCVTLSFDKIDNNK